MSTAGRAPLRAFARRRFPRSSLSVPVRVTVMRAGTAYSLPGRSVDLGEGGIAVVLGGEIRTSDSVGVEFLLPHLGLGLQAKAIVRHHSALRCGLEFRGLTRHQQAVIREWSRQNLNSKLGQAGTPDREAQQPSITRFPKFFLNFARFELSGWPQLLWVGAAILLVALMIFWWRWQSEWRELEERIHQPVHQSLVAPAGKPLPAAFSPHIWISSEALVPESRALFCSRPLFAKGV